MLAIGEGLAQHGAYHRLADSRVRIDGGAYHETPYLDRHNPTCIKSSS